MCVPFVSVSVVPYFMIHASCSMFHVSCVLNVCTRALTRPAAAHSLFLSPQPLVS